MSSRTWVVGAAVAAVAVLASVFRGPAVQSGGCAETASFLAERREVAQGAVRRAAAWLDTLPVDPVELRRRGLRGKKHFVEALSAQVRLHRIASEAEKPAVMEKIRRLTATTSTDEYHDLLVTDELAFKQDATSYLRAALLMERLGLDTTAYRDHIRAIAPRLDAQMKSRGVHQQLAFAWYYRHFGLKEPFPLAAASREGVIARRIDPHTMTKVQIYDLTHEIFVPYEFGDRLDAEPFTADERAWLIDALHVLIDRRIGRNDPDLVAELVTCLRYLRATGIDAYRRGLQFLLDTQQPRGAWGSYEQHRAKLGDLVDQAYVLHTTSVTIDALALAFYPPWTGEGACVAVMPPRARVSPPHEAEDVEEPHDEQ